MAGEAEKTDETCVISHRRIQLSYSQPLLIHLIELARPLSKSAKHRQLRLKSPLHF